MDETQKNSSENFSLKKALKDNPKGAFKAFLFLFLALLAVAIIICILQRISFWLLGERNLIIGYIIFGFFGFCLCKGAAHPSKW